MRTSLADTRPEDDDETGLVAEEPAPATISRRGVLALVGGGALLVGVLSVGQTVGRISATGSSAAYRRARTLVRDGAERFSDQQDGIGRADHWTIRPVIVGD